MRHRYAYPGPEGAPFEIPDRHETTLCRSLAPPPARPASEILAEAFERPAGTPPLRDIVAAKRRVLLLVDDATRATPVADVLPHVARELEAAGVPDERVRVLTAQGTHRRMTTEELDAKLGAPFRRRWRVEQHDWRDARALVHVGETHGGMPVIVNRLLTQSDVVIGIGSVGVHGIMGFSGGAKIVLPGVCGAPTEGWTHWNATRYRQEALMGVVENPIRKEIEEGARMAGLAAVVNVVLDAQARVQHAAVGDPVRAQRACAKVARDVHAVRLPSVADVVITNSAPADRDYWQSIKGLYAATLAVRDGGRIVLVSPNPEGVADNHPELLDLAPLTLEEIRERVAAASVGDVIAAAVAAFTARIRERSDVTLVSSGVAAHDVRRLRFDRARDTQSAIDAALSEASGATVAVLDGGGHLLPLVPTRNL